MWLNLSGLRVTLEDDAARRMALGAVVLTSWSGPVGGLGVFRFSFGRGGRAGPAAFGIVVFASLAVPLWLRGSAHATPRAPPAGRGRVSSFAAFPRGRVTMLLLDGASLDFISPAVADGRLPNVARILEAGAVMHLATLRPTQPAPVLTAIATGKLPLHTGVRSAALYRARPAGPSSTCCRTTASRTAWWPRGCSRNTPTRRVAARAAALGDPELVGHWRGCRPMAADVSRVVRSGRAGDRPPSPRPPRLPLRPAECRGLRSRPSRRTLPRGRSGRRSRRSPAALTGRAPTMRAGRRSRSTACTAARLDGDRATRSTAGGDALRRARHASVTTICGRRCRVRSAMFRRRSAGDMGRCCAVLPVHRRRDRARHRAARAG